MSVSYDKIYYWLDKCLCVKLFDYTTKHMEQIWNHGKGDKPTKAYSEFFCFLL